jgi:TPR repeat protein
MKSICILSLTLFLFAGCSEVPGDAAYRSGHHAIAAGYYEDQYRHGSIPAGFRYAQMLSQGDGIPKDDEKAFLIYSDLASRGEPLAFHDLGVCYEKGTGTGKNLLKAEESYRRAADAGVLWAIYNLGTMYSNRLTQKDDDVEGLTLLLRAQRLASGNSENEAWIREDKFGAHGGHVAKMRARMTPEQIARAEEAAKK